MGTFADWAQNYYDTGLSVLPVHPEKKACFIAGWTDKFSKKFPNENEQQHYIEKYADHDLGLACGKSSGIVAIDFDYVDMADAKVIESLVIGALPETQVIKKGQKGWTRFYRFDGEVKNMSIDRFGSRMIDILSTGRLTVLPPSMHKAGMPYTWIGGVELLDSDESDMAMIHSNHINQLVEISQYDNSIFNEVLKKTSRHDAVVGFILRYSDQAKDIEDLIQKTIEADIRLHTDDPKGPYLSDKNYLKGKGTYEFTQNLCERVCEWKSRTRKEKHGIDWSIGKYPRLHADGKKSSTNYDDFKSFFEFNYPNVRYDKIRRTAYYFCNRSRKWEPIDNIREVIESRASDAGLSPSYVNRHLQRWLSGFEPRLCIDIPRWQGRDVISEMVGRLEITNIKHSHAVELFKEWGANIFRRLNDKSKREQNTMIILKGEQGIGKDSWINHCFGGFGPYFSEIEMQDRKIEIYQTVGDLLVANIPEFDETHRISLSTLKSVITSSGAKFRAAYARKAEFVPFYVSYISSCNFDNVLRDSSGNRRFMIFDVEKIRWGYDDIPPDQLLAQFQHLYNVGFKASKSARQSMNEYIKGETPDSIDDLIESDCRAVIQGYTSMLNPWVEWSTISDDIHKISRRYGVSLRRVQSIMKRKGFQKHDRNGKFYTHIPQPVTNRHDLKTH